MLAVRLLAIAACLGLAACAAEPAAQPTLPAAPEPATQQPLDPKASAAHAPLTPQDIAACPVTLPNDRSPDGAPTNMAGFNLGNDNRTLFTIPWPGGAVVFTPHGAGSQHADGSLAMKWPWYRTVPGEVVITARRLDADTPPPEPVILRGPEDGYGTTGFHPSGLKFSSEGCWEVTARAAGESLTFVTLAVRLPFDPPQFTWWPPDLERSAAVDLSGYPTAYRQIARSPNGGELMVDTVLGELRLDGRAPEGSRQQVTLQTSHDGPAICAQGAVGDDRVWHSGADQVLLQWPLDGLTYRIIAAGLAFDCPDLLRIANSQF